MKIESRNLCYLCYSCCSYLKELSTAVFAFSLGIILALLAHYSRYSAITLSRRAQSVAPALLAFVLMAGFALQLQISAQLWRWRTKDNAMRLVDAHVLPFFTRIRPCARYNMMTMQAKVHAKDQLCACSCYTAFFSCTLKVCMHILQFSDDTEQKNRDSDWNFSF